MAIHDIESSRAVVRAGEAGPTEVRVGAVSASAVFSHDAHRWVAVPDAEAGVRSLVGWSGLPQEDFQELKVRRDQAVWLGTLPFGDEKRRVVVKTSRNRRLRLHLFHLFGPTRAAREWQNHQRAAAAGLPVVAPLALGQRHRWGTPVDSVLISEFWENDGTLEQLAAEPDGARFLQPLLAELGAVVQAMHRADLLHGDMHPGNVLVRLSGEDRLRVIDWKHVNWRAERRGGVAGQLAKLVWQFRLAGVFNPRHCDLEDSFFRGYGAGMTDVHALRDEVEVQVRETAARLGERAARRCTETNSTFEEQAFDGFVAQVRRDPGLAALPEGFREPEALARMASDGPVRHDLGVGRTLRVERQRNPAGGAPSSAEWQALNRGFALDPRAPLPLAWIRGKREADTSWLVWIEAN